MKTVLFATTALVASAGIAAAEVSLSGSAEMGVIGGDDIETQFHTDIDVTFTMSGETDTGLLFGANIDLDESDGDPSGAFGNTTQGGESIFVSGPFGTLTMGDTDGALDWAMQEAIIGSSINDDHEHAGYLGTIVIPVDTTGDGIADSTEVRDVVDGNAALDGTYDGQIARYEYAFADFSVAVSGEIDDAGDGDPVLGLGFKYATEFSGVDMAFGLGVQRVGALDEIIDDVVDAIDPDKEVDNLTVWGASADMKFAMGLRTILNYSDYDELGSHWGVAVGYSWDAFTVAANYGKFNTDFEGGEDSDGYGLVADYDLGGGAELQAGYGHSDTGFDDYDTYSLGISMSF